MRQSLQLRLLTTAFVFSGLIGSSFAHTPDETNEVARALLHHVAMDARFDCFRPGQMSVRRRFANTWERFLDIGFADWTFEEKKAAFDWYLSTLGTNDCQSLDAERKEHIRLALRLCNRLNHTNAWPHLKALALNPHGVYREDANELAIKFGPVDDAMTDFVELIGTNVVTYNYVERGTYCTYQERLAAIPATNAAAVAVRERAVRRFYQHRFNPSAAGSVSRDELFRDYLAGYAQSSNRLEFACHILGIEEGRINDGEYFITLTNQLLSSGQPLRQLNIGGNNQ